MRTIKTLLRSTALLCTFCATGALADEKIAVLAESYSETSAATVAEAMADLFNGLGAGDRLLAIKAGTGETIFDARVPDEPIYDSHKGHRDKLLVPSWRQAMAFLSQTIEAADKLGDADLLAQVDYPNTLEALGMHAARDPEIMIYGNPIYVDPRQADFAMVKGYPTDAHLFRSRGQTPFGTQGLENSLEPLRIHFCLTQDSWINDAHEEGVQRFYSLMTSAFGARLATFSADVPGCAARFADGTDDGARSYLLDVEDDRYGMIDVTRPVEIAITPAKVPAPSVPTTLQPAIPQVLQEEIAAGIAEMRTLQLFDTDAEDGDVVEIVAPGFSKTVRLTKRVQEVEVPVRKGALHVVGKATGQGGITVGILTESGRKIVSQSIAVGESLAIPING